MDVIWSMMLRDGRGGMIDYPKYRDALTDIIWHGNMPEQSTEQTIQDTKDAIGKPPSEATWDEARALRDRMNAPKEPEKD